MAYVLLNFTDGNGRVHAAKIPMKYYEELLFRAKIQDNLSKGRRTYEEPYFTGQPRIRLWVDDEGVIRRAREPKFEQPHNREEFQFSFKQAFTDPIDREIFENLFGDFLRGDHSPAGSSSMGVPRPNLVKLFEMAGVEYSVDYDQQKLLRRAKSKCHPDTGGSSEQWIELEKIARSLNLKW